jgi:MFS family permease
MAADARRLLVARGLRGFADGLVSLLVASYLPRLGLAPFAVGVVLTGTLLGSAALTLAVGFIGHRLRRRAILLATSALMVATGLGFAGFTSFWPLLVVAVVGTLNPSAGDVTPFLPTEQAVLADAVPAADRTATFAWYNVAGAAGGAVGALAAGGLVGAERIGFLVYSAIGLVAALLYVGLSAERPLGRMPTALARSRCTVLELAALFSVDSFGGGFVVQSLLALWLFRRFGLRAETAATLFFVTGLLGAASQPLSARLAARIGHVRTMVFTHLPANLFLIAAGLAPAAGVVVALLILRMCLSQMDVPARQAYVMAVVPPEERPAAAAVTNVPRSLAAALAPVLAGALLERSSLGWPLVIGGALKAAYDLALYRRFANVRPAEGS